MDNLLRAIISTKERIDAEPDNDYFLFHFVALVLDVIDYDKGGCLTKEGRILLTLNIDKIMYDFGTYTDIKQYDQKDLLKALLYFTICYNVCSIYIGFISLMDTDEAKHIVSAFPESLVETLHTIKDRVLPLVPQIEIMIRRFQPLLTDEYAELYAGEKRRCFVKPIFDANTTTEVINKDLPDVVGAIEVKQ
jgi:hypothetical protein